MADTDISLYNLRYNQVTNKMEGFGGGTPQWTPLTIGSGGGSFPAVVAAVNLTGQHADIPPTSVFTPSVTGRYRASIYIVCTASDASLGNISATISWTDDSGSQSLGSFADVDLSVVGNFVQSSAVLEVTGGSAISYSFVEGGDPYGTTRYSLYLVLEQLN